MTARPAHDWEPPLSEGDRYTARYTQGRGSVTVDCADGWRRMVPERYIRQLAIVRTP